MDNILNLLLVEDSETDAQLILRQLKEDGFHVRHERVDNRDSMNNALNRGGWNIIISDYIMPNFSGLESLKLLQERGIDVPCIVVSGQISEETAVSAMRNGARDYVMKDNLKRLGPAVKRELSSEKLKISEAFNYSMLDSSPNPILVSSPDTSVIYVNPALENLTGYTSQELIGKRLPYIWWPKERLEQYNREALEDTKIIREERCYRKKNGEIFWIALSITTVRERDEVKYILSNWVDITERRKAEEALYHSEEKLKKVFESIADGILITDTNGFIVDCNDNIVKILRYGLKNEVLGHNFTYYITATEQELALKNLQQTLASGPTRDLKYSAIQKDGSIIPIEVSTCVARDNSGNPLFVVISLRDIVERKKMEARIVDLYEEEKKHRQQLQEETKARGLFIDVLAHELRTPLTPILASTGMLQDLLSPEGGIQKKLATNIYNSAQTLSRRLEELLDLARFARGVFELHKTPTDINRFINEVVSRFSPSIEQRNQKLILELSKDLPRVQIDQSRLEQVIINLLSNASKFSPDRSVIMMRTGMREGRLFIDVEDKGIGISPEEQKRLFQPYHRVEQDRQKFSGIGLGLAVSKQIVETHGGKISLTSQSGQGSTFSVQLPV